MLSDDAHTWIFAVLDMVSEVDLKYSDLVVSACSDVVYTYQLLSQCGSLCKHEQLNLPVLQCLAVTFCGTAALPTRVVSNQHHARSTRSELLLQLRYTKTGGPVTQILRFVVNVLHNIVCMKVHDAPTRSELQAYRRCCPYWGDGLSFKYHCLSLSGGLPGYQFRCSLR